MIYAFRMTSEMLSHLSLFERVAENKQGAKTKKRKRRRFKQHTTNLEVPQSTRVSRAKHCTAGNGQVFYSTPSFMSPPEAWDLPPAFEIFLPREGIPSPTSWTPPAPEA